MSTITRLFGATLAVSMLSLGFVGAGGAVAADATPTHAALAVHRSGATTDPTLRKPARHVELIGTKTGRVTFRLHGHVRPRYRHQLTLLQYKAKKHGTFHVIRMHKTNTHSIYSYKSVSKPGFYRVKVKASHGFRTSFSTVGHIYRL